MTLNHVNKINFIKINTQFELEGKKGLFLSNMNSRLFEPLTMSVLDFKARMDSLTSSPAHNRFLRSTWGATPADLFAASMAAELFHPGICV